MWADLYQNTQFVAARNVIFGTNLRKLKFWAPIVSSIKNVQRSLKKLQLLTSYFLLHDANGYDDIYICGDNSEPVISNQKMCVITGASW